MSDLIERQVAIDAAIEAVDEWDGGCSPTRADMIADAINNTVPSAQSDRSLWFRIGEICVDESKGFISAGRAVEKIRELLREAERREG